MSGLQFWRTDSKASAGVVVQKQLGDTLKSTDDPVSPFEEHNRDETVNNLSIYNREKWIVAEIYT